MKIILLAADFPPSLGGIQQYVASLAKALANAGADMHVVATAQPQSQQFDAEANYEILRVAGGGKRQVWQQMEAAAVELAGGSAETAVVATKWFPEGPAALGAARSTGGVSAMIGYDREFALHGLNFVKWGMQKHVLGNCDIIFAISGFTVKQLRKMGVARVNIYQLGAGLDAEQFYPDMEGAEKLRKQLGLQDARVICTVSRLAAHKGHRYVLEALLMVAEQVPEVKYVIVGEGPYRRRLEKCAQVHQVKERVVFTGQVPLEQLRQFYTMAEVMILASFDLLGHPAEGFGLSFLEANACGTPVIGTRTGGIPEAVADRESGLLVPPRDHETVANALIRLLEDRDYAVMLGKLGRKRVTEEFSWASVAQRLMAGLETVAPSPPAPL